MPSTVNQVLPPAAEAEIAEVFRELTAELEKERVAPVTPVAAFDEDQSRLAARIYGLDPVRNTQADLVAIIREHRLPISPACGGRASRTKRTIINELRRHVGQEPLAVPMGTPVRPLASPPRARSEVDAQVPPQPEPARAAVRPLNPFRHVVPPQPEPARAAVRPLASPTRVRPETKDLPSSRLRSRSRAVPDDSAESDVADVGDELGASGVGARPVEAAPAEEEARSDVEDDAREATSHVAAKAVSTAAAAREEAAAAQVTAHAIAPTARRSMEPWR